LKSSLCHRTFGAILLSLAGGVLIVAYVGICVRVGSFWPWNEVVHEDGQRTLISTVLYFEHATRELPLDILLGLVIGGSVLFVVPPNENWTVPKWGGQRVTGFALVTALVVAIILMGTAFEGGLSVVLANFLQYHTRPGVALVWGSHWHYHLLSRLGLILISVGLAGLLRRINGGRGGGRERKGLGVVIATITLFFALTVLFSISLSSVLLSVFDPVFLGHQARELFTHVLVTVPAAWGFCLLLSRNVEITSLEEGLRSYSWPMTASAGVIGALLGVYVCAGALMTDAASYGQTSDVTMLVFPHFFEHSFTYAVVLSVAALVYELVGSTTTAAKSVLH